MKKQLLFILMMLMPMMSCAQELVPFKDKTTIDETGKEVVPCQFLGGSDFHEGLANIIYNNV